MWEQAGLTALVKLMFLMLLTLWILYLILNSRVGLWLVYLYIYFLLANKLGDYSLKIEKVMAGSKNL